MTDQTIKIGLVSISDRASTGVYQDLGLPHLQEWLGKTLITPWQAETRLIPDERAEIECTLKQLVDEVGCHLILTTGGTGPSIRDVTPEATLAIGDREMPGFGEQMRQISLNFVATAILSRPGWLTWGCRPVPMDGSMLRRRSCGPCSAPTKHCR